MAVTANKTTRKKTAARKGDKPWAGASTTKKKAPRSFDVNAQAEAHKEMTAPTTSVKGFALAHFSEYSDKALIDLLGDLNNELTKVGALPLVKQASSIRDELMTRCGKGQGVDEEKTYDGKRWGIKLGPKAKSRTIKSMAAVIKAMGQKKFLAKATVPLGVLDKALSEDVVKKLVTEKQEGARRLTIFAQ